MKTLALRNGDLIATQQGHATATGSERVRLDLAVALGQEFGTDRFHLKFGSYLKQFIGNQIGPELAFAVEAEVVRVVNNYISIQQQIINQDALKGRRSRFSTADIVSEITSAEAQPYFDRIYIRLRLRTVAGEQITIIKSVTP
jgi:phage baseplate assembly protein W